MLRKLPKFGIKFPQQNGTQSRLYLDCEHNDLNITITTSLQWASCCVHNKAQKLLLPIKHWHQIWYYCWSHSIVTCIIWDSNKKSDDFLFAWKEKDNKETFMGSLCERTLNMLMKCRNGTNSHGWWENLVSLPQKKIVSHADWIQRYRYPATCHY